MPVHIMKLASKDDTLLCAHDMQQRMSGAQAGPYWQFCMAPSPTCVVPTSWVRVKAQARITAQAGNVSEARTMVVTPLPKAQYPARQGPSKK